MTQVVPRATILFFVLWMITRSIGRKELAQLSAFELLMLVVMGDLIQQGITMEDQSLTGAVLAIGTFALLTLVFSTLSYRWRRSRPIIEGEAVLILQNGRPLQGVMKLERLTLDEVKEAARQQGIGDLSQVRCGVLEANGKFSFIKSDDSQTAEGDESVLH